MRKNQNCKNGNLKKMFKFHFYCKTLHIRYTIIDIYYCDY